MSSYFWDWLNLFFRWFHVITGIAWIGASFYFVWLDNSLQSPPQWKKDKGIKGDLWAIHGGGFYEVAKYHLAPERMPATLHWFKWEAYTTWLTGMVLLGVVYYANAGSYLITSGDASLGVTGAVLFGIGFIIAGTLMYEGLLRTPLKKNGAAFGLVLFLLLVAASWLACNMLAPRAAYIHVGALIGTLMAGNVFLGIIPAQKALVKAVQVGKTPDPALAAFAKLRSTHNNYFTLPLIFIMISNHYPMTYSHPYNWAILAAIGFISALTRHYFNLRHHGKRAPWILLIAALLLFCLAGVITPEHSPSLRPNDLSAAQALSILERRCTSCHAKQPTQPGFAAPPAGLVLESMAEVNQQRARIQQVIQSQYMPLGNVTGMTQEERDQINAWLSR